MKSVLLQMFTEYGGMMRATSFFAVFIASTIFLYRFEKVARPFVSIFGTMAIFLGSYLSFRSAFAIVSVLFVWLVIVMHATRNSFSTKKEDEEA